MKELYLIGGGMGSSMLLTGEARKIIETADVLYATGRIASVSSARKPIILKLNEIAACVQTDEHAFQAVILSGDPGLYSAMDYLHRCLPEVRLIPVCGISSLQYMAARIGRGYEYVRILSLHGRRTPYLAQLSMNSDVFMLTGGAYKAGDILKDMTANSLGNLEIWAGENLSGPRERLLHDSAEALSEVSFSDLTVLWCINPSPAVPYRIYRDGDFIRGKVPMTKDSVRLMILKELALEPDDVVWDIGAGTGSVSMQCASFLPEGSVFSIEQREEAVALIDENRSRLGLFHVQPVFGRAPKILEDLPKPDAVYIGGSDGCLKDVLLAVTQRNPDARIVMSCVTMETLETIREIWRQAGLTGHLKRIQVEQERPLGRYTVMESEHAVWLMTRVTAERKGEDSDETG